MSIERIEETEAYKIEVNQEVDTVVYTRKSYVSGETFRHGPNALIEFLRNNDFSKMVLDLSGIQAHTDEDKKWVQEEWTPDVLETGITDTAVVHPPSVIAEMNIEQIMSGIEAPSHETFITDSRAKALEWIADR
jgi:hypothetical protein